MHLILQYAFMSSVQLFRKQTALFDTVKEPFVFAQPSQKHGTHVETRSSQVRSVRAVVAETRHKSRPV